jgi:hypothetical protein
MLEMLLTFVGAGLVFAAVGLPLALRWIGPNVCYGVRLSMRMLQDRQLWYDVNAFCGLRMILMGVFTCAVAIALYFRLSDETAYALAGAGWIALQTVAVTVGTIVAYFRFAGKTVS